MSEPSLPESELKAYVEQAAAWARQVGAIHLRYLHADDKAVEHKGAIDLVTAADKAAEAYLVAQIEAMFPQHDYVAEEGHRKSTGADLTWYIDPLDGTTNFAHGYPVFCVSIAVVANGAPVAGVIYDPCRQELFTAYRGGGAFLNGQRLHVSPHTKIKDALLCSGFPYAFATDDRNLRLWSAFLHASLSVRRDGSAALDLCSVAAGRFGGFWELGLQSWDIAAGALLVTEAGGKVTQFDGGPLELDGRAIVASNGAIHAAMLNIIRENGAS